MDQTAMPISELLAHLGANVVDPGVLACNVVFTVASTVVVGLRWYTRVRLVRCIGFDDYVILAAELVAWASCAIAAVQAHESAHTDEHRTLRTQLLVANNSLWIVAVTITKCSILVQYLRIFITRGMRIAIWTLLCVLILAMINSLLLDTLLCSPPKKLWLPETPGYCRSPVMAWTIPAAVNMALDILTLSLPLPAISRLHLPPKQKRWLVALFLLGFMVCAVSTVRLALVSSTNQMGKLRMSVRLSHMLSIIEANVGIICASLLALKPLIAKLMPSLMEDRAGEIPRHCMRINTVAANDLFVGGPPAMRVGSDEPNMMRIDSTATTPKSKVSFATSKASVAELLRPKGSKSSTNLQNAATPRADSHATLERAGSQADGTN